MTVASNADPFAAASMAGNSTPAAPDSNADPFATPDEVGGPGGPKRPALEDLDGRLVVIKPISVEAAAPVNAKYAKTPGETQRRWTVDLTVLNDGKGAVNVWDADLGGEGKGGYVQVEVPYTWTGMWMSQKGLVPKLDGLVKDGRPFLLGVVGRCPDGAGYKKGKTPADTAREWNEYVAAGKPDRLKPNFSWGLIDPTPEERAIALAWYRGQQ